MEEMAIRQRDLLSEVYSSLKGSIDGIRYIMSLFLVEMIGVETFVVAVAAWVVIFFLPQFNYSRFWLHVLLMGEQVLEILLRKVYGRMVQETPQPAPDKLVS